MIINSKQFGLNLLAIDQIELCKATGSSTGAKVDKFKQYNIPAFMAADIDVPLITGCVCNMECVLEDSFKAGDHTIFVGKIVRLHALDNKKPLLAFRHNYHSLGKVTGKF